MTGLELVPRSSWGARPSTGALAPVEPAERRFVVVHYSTGQELGRPDVPAWLRSIQAFHQGPERRWSDIGYNVLVSADGRAWEGRGLDVQGAHAPGRNRDGYGVCFLGNDDPAVQDVTPAARRTLALLVAELGRRSGHALAVVGHRDTQRAGYTSCPGDELAGWLRAGMPLERPNGVNPPLTPDRPSRARPPAGTLAPPYGGRALFHGSRGSAVRRFQQRLRERGWSIVADGIFGPATEAVVEAFQREKGLVVDGIVGPATWRAAWLAPVT